MPPSKRCTVCILIPLLEGIPIPWHSESLLGVIPQGCGKGGGNAGHAGPAFQGPLNLLGTPCPGIWQSLVQAFSLQGFH